MTPCPFCQIAAEEPGPVIAIEPLNPIVPGHMLFVPKRHLTDAAEDPMETGRVTAVAAHWASQTYGSWNLITSVGIPATQSVFHLHLHVVPRKFGDGLVLPWTGQIKK